MILPETAEFVLGTETARALIDHESFPGNLATTEKRAVEFAGQLAVDAVVIESVSRKVLLGSYIHLPISGLMVQVETSD